MPLRETAARTPNCRDRRPPLLLHLGERDVRANSFGHTKQHTHANKYDARYCINRNPSMRFISELPHLKPNPQTYWPRVFRRQKLVPPQADSSVAKAKPSSPQQPHFKTLTRFSKKTRGRLIAFPTTARYDHGIVRARHQIGVVISWLALRDFLSFKKIYKSNFINWSRILHSSWINFSLESLDCILFCACLSWFPDSHPHDRMLELLQCNCVFCSWVR